MSFVADRETPLSTTSFLRPSQIPSFTSNEISMPDEPHAMDPSDNQVQALHERCQMELPENFPAPRGDAAQEDLQMQLRLVEEMNRRKAIGERMYLSTRTVGMGIAEQRRT
ncbi:hypothetical protein BDV33DRAFT_195073 [Aspergillus novoparasiticus]|uniref:Uncharacterized protein n=1 Tax=Aspergillus novoparasiticus TaxID=986946 RepID=A0A5N6EFS9_9EURO|nr:hypothetical protein BDV33DRAFT_195073 [Aspergillus novoparasiticus]